MSGALGATARGGPSWQSVIAFVAVGAALLLPVVVVETGTSWLVSADWTLVAVVILCAAVLASFGVFGSLLGALLILVGAAIAGVYALAALPIVAGEATGAAPGSAAIAAPGFWGLVIATWALSWLAVDRLSAIPASRPVGDLLLRILAPVIFGAAIIFLWEVLVRAFHVPFVIMPPPSAIWARLVTEQPTLWADFRQTFLKAVIAGYAIGCGSGFIVAIFVDRIPFLRRGLLPVGNLASALPIVGIAPIMVMWFGFDWPSKAAVVVAMTFFPMLVNTLAGLSASDHMERDLMRTYAASYWQSLFKLRLPAALPFIFNALKINSTLAMIGAIVAEFFGTPIVGMGFRISTEVGRMNTDMVWAEIAVAALAGSAFYGVVALIERAATFWHPSFRRRQF